MDTKPVPPAAVPERKLTLGESRVRIGFNPSADNTVDRIKRLGADFIDEVEKLRAEFNGNGEAQRLIALAQTHAEDAAMWGVKAATTGK